jgi:dihydroorotase
MLRDVAVLNYSRALQQGNLLVDKEADIEKVISSSDRIVSIHSEDEDIIKLRKKFIKKGDVHSHAEWRNVECAMSSTRRVG